MDSRSTNSPAEAHAALDCASSNESFEECYCAERHIGPDQFERRLFLDGVSWYSRPLARLMLVLGPSAFEGEIEYLRALRPVKTRKEFLSEIGVIADFNQYQLPLWRSLIGLRISSRRISKLRKVLPKVGD